MVPSSGEDDEEYEGDTEEHDSSAKAKKQKKGKDVDPLVKAKSRKKSQGPKSEAPEKEKRKKNKEADIPPLPSTATFAKLACDNCLRRERPCFHKNQEEADDPKATCWECKYRHVSCKAATVVSTGFNILQIRLGQFGTHLNFKNTGGMAPGAVGEGSDDLDTLGDVFVELVDNVRSLRDENRRLRADVKDLATQLASLDSRVALNHNANVNGVNGLARQIMTALNAIGLAPDVGSIKRTVEEVMDAKLDVLLNRIRHLRSPSATPRQPQSTHTPLDSHEEGDRAMASGGEGEEGGGEGDYAAGGGNEIDDQGAEGEQGVDEEAPMGSTVDEVHAEDDGVVAEGPERFSRPVTPTSPKALSNAPLSNVDDVPGSPQSAISAMPSTGSSVSAEDSVSQVGVGPPPLGARTRQQRRGLGDGADPQEEPVQKKRKAPAKSTIAEGPDAAPDNAPDLPVKKRKLGAGGPASEVPEDPARSPTKPTRGGAAGRGRGGGRKGGK